ncbi:hypothetical protein RHGRI_023363 [Rhododendron griersonianum]|uniref:Uncharacterized protein n=2 Tax=Rhododendron griersonianum TaxID=479676 RepID=A0AAV6J5B3_9ERIC|nr:hypothetical protein RHGRI_023363 [Rhododendron griersonianum]
MARAQAACLSFCFLVLSLSLILSPTQARPFNVMKGTHNLEGLMLSLGGIKDSGPSPGAGHHFTNSHSTLGGIKDSGPSPGQGNKFVTGTKQ